MTQPHFHSYYNKLKSMVDERLARVASANGPTSLYEPTRYLLCASGKRIRPALVMLACEASGGAAASALDAAVGAEMVHNFTLVHDDIMDNAAQRRGRASVHTKWNENTAILTGDVVLASAYNILLGSLHERVREVAMAFTRGVIDVCEGQAYDTEFERRADVTMEEYLMMIEKKTAKLLEMCVEVGAHIGGANDSSVQALRQYARHLGIAFQITDDLLDVVADEEALGKKVGSDISRGKKTFLLIDALEHARLGSFDERDRTMIESVVQHHGTAEENVSTVQKIYERYGITAHARSAVAEHIRAAKNCLGRLAASEARSMLGWLADETGARKF